MSDHPVVSKDEWLVARRELLAKEKELTRLTDEVTQARQKLPWTRVDKPYTFHTVDGQASLSDLFGKHSQLIIYHFMFDPEWDEGCKSCSLLVDHYVPLLPHLAARDTSLVTVSRAPLDKLQTFRRRMNWDIPWVSSYESDFNWDFRVSFTQEQLDTGTMFYNFSEGCNFPVTEAPGISSFLRDEQGAIFHTYSAFARGLETYMGIYRLLDIVARGRDESELPYGMAWVRHHDNYDDASFVDPYIGLQ